MKREGLMKSRKRGQVWIETIIYTAIALVMIAAILAFARPKIEEFQDKAVISKNRKMMEDLSNVILQSAQATVGETKTFSIDIEKGNFIIDCEKDRAQFKLIGKSKYSELNNKVVLGKGLTSTTFQSGKNYEVTLESDYSSYDLVCNMVGTVEDVYTSDDRINLEKSAVSYNMIIQNKGTKTTTDVPPKKYIVLNFKAA